jgi:DNA-binding response OmpR family regulator
VKKSRLVLIIDDDYEAQRLLKHVLARASLDAVIAFDADSSYQIIAEQKDNIILILLDIALPGPDGFEICRTLREELDVTVPIIAVTALSSDEMAHDAIKAGFSEMLGKPFSIKTFREMLDRFASA